MRWLALSGLCGCSLIYNPNNLPNPPPADAMPDAEVIFDADPTMLSLQGVSPALIYEGQGDQSRPAVITISGHHMVKNTTSVAITVHPGQSKTATITVDNTKLDVAADGDMVAVPVALPVDMNLGAADTLALDVALTQDTPTGPITKTIVGKLSLQGLPELKDGDSVTPTNSAPLYTHSRVMLTGPISTATNMAPVVVRATSTVTIGGTINFNGNPTNGTGASIMVAGPGGGAGGAGGTNVLGSQGGSPGTGPAAGAANGGGGGWGGNDQLTTLANPDRSSGGGGGDGATAGSGGNGGGGGGSIEVTADGDVTVGTVHANGATGGPVGGLGAKGGGGGSGGAILLRSTSGKVMSGSITVDGGAAGGTGATAGSPGRIRIDSPMAITGPATYFRGPTFAAATPLIVRQESPMLTITAQGGRNIQYYTSTADGTETHGPVTMLMPANGTTVFTMAIPLFRGSNRLCAMVEGGAASTPEAANCITISYLYTP